jgi:phosphatidylglycerophosphatase A
VRPRFSRAVATFGYLGLLPGPTGTWASVAAVPLAYALHWLGGFPLLAAATALVYALGHWATRVEICDKDDLDPGEIVVDEVAGQWVALWPLSAGLGPPARRRMCFPGRAGPRPLCSSGCSTSASRDPSAGPTAGKARPA